MVLENFDIEKECKTAGIDVDNVYEPYKHARGHVIVAEYLQKPPLDEDRQLINKLEMAYPSIREIADNHTAWVKAQRESLKERSLH